MIRFSCASCGKRYAVDDRLAGRSTACKGCKSAMTIPTPEAAYEALEENPLLPEVDEAAGGAQCPACRRAMAAGAVLCVGCGYDRRTSRSMRTEIGRGATAQGASSMGRAVLGQPLLYVVLAAAVVLPTILWAAGVPAAMALMGCGGLMAFACMVWFRFKMRRAMREGGSLAPYAKFVPVFGFFFRIFYVVKFWNRAPISFAGMLLGLFMCLCGVAVMTHGFSTPMTTAMHQTANPDVAAAPSTPIAPPLPPPQHLAPHIDLYDIYMTGERAGEPRTHSVVLPTGEEAVHDVPLPCDVSLHAGGDTDDHGVVIIAWSSVGACAVCASEFCGRGV